MGQTGGGTDKNREMNGQMGKHPRQREWMENEMGRQAEDRKQNRHDNGHSDLG